MVRSVGRPSAVTTLRVHPDSRGVLHIVGTCAGVRVRQSTGLRVGEEADAFSMKAQIEARLLGQKDRGAEKTLRDAAESYKQWKKAERTLDPAQERRVDRLVEELGDKPLSAITTDFLRDWVVEKSSDDEDGERDAWSPGTIKRVATNIKAILNEAVRREWLAKLPKFPTITVHDERDVHYSEAEAKLVIAYVKAHHVEHWPMIVFLMHVGARLSEMLRVEWRHIDLSGREVTIVKKATTGRQKTKTRTIPMSADVYEALVAMAPRAADRRGRPFPPLDRSTIGKQLAAVLEDASEKLGVERLRVHDLRHTFAFLVASKGADLGDLQLLLGHASIAMTMRYRGWVKNRAKAAISAF